VAVSRRPHTQARPAAAPVSASADARSSNAGRAREAGGSRSNGPSRVAGAKLVAGRSWWSSARALLRIGGPLLLVGALAWPLLFSEATFNEDWLNHLWYVWHQSLAIRGNHLPSLFLNYSHGVFYPLYAFYGGTVYALAGTLSLALGNAPLDAYVLTYLLGFLAAYTGWYWASRMFGVGRWLAHVPAIVFLTSASYLMIIYGLGDWPEFLAVSVMPLMIASGLSVIRAERLRLLPAGALAGSSIVFFGSHLLTVIWGSTVLMIVGGMILAFVPAARASMRWPNVLRVLAIVIPAAMVSAWFLLPTVAYEANTVIAHSYPIFRHLLRREMHLVAAHHLFTLSRTRTAGTIVTTALPVLAIVWVLAGIFIALRTGRGGTWMRLLLVLCAATALLVIVMTHAGLILALPRIYATLQFSFRLESYVLLGISGAVLAALVVNRDGGRAARYWIWTLVPVLAVSIIGAVQQTGAHPAGLPRSAALSSYLGPTYEQEGLLDYVDDHAYLIKKHLPVVTFPPESVRNDRAAIVVNERPGQLVDTNIRSAPELIHITGARVVGEDDEANDVLEVRAPAGTSSQPGAETITVTSADSTPIAAGRALSGLAVAILALELLLLAAPGSLGKRVRGVILSLMARRQRAKAA
jgi:hypothetical protein